MPLRLLSDIGICLLSYHGLRRWLQSPAALWLAILVAVIAAAFLQLI